MKEYGLLGAKLGHSYSKIIHSQIFKMFNIDAKYSLIECKESDLELYLELLKQGKYQGFNVTIPYKKAIMNLLDIVDEKAENIGSVNTVYLKDGKTVGTNTDFDGFLETIRYYNIPIENKNCYILGTGGAALAVYSVIRYLKGNAIFVSRNPLENQIGYQELENCDIDVLINTTPVGMYPNIDQSPVSKEISCKAKEVIDIIFNPTRTKLLKDCKKNINGFHMLIMQAFKAEEIWQEKKLEFDIEVFKKQIGGVIDEQNR